MSTRSSILFEAKDGSVTSAFCHWDGYPHDGGVGENLFFWNLAVFGTGAISDWDSTKITHWDS